MKQHDITSKDTIMESTGNTDRVDNIYTSQEAEEKNAAEEKSKLPGHEQLKLRLKELGIGSDILNVLDKDLLGKIQVRAQDFFASSKDLPGLDRLEEYIELAQKNESFLAMSISGHGIGSKALRIFYAKDNVAALFEVALTLQGITKQIIDTVKVYKQTLEHMHKAVSDNKLQDRERLLLIESSNEPTKTGTQIINQDNSEKSGSLLPDPMAVQWLSLGNFARALKGRKE